jgi:hypothetical protein
MSAEEKTDKPRRGRRAAVLLALTGLVVALVANKQVRLRVLDLLFGDEEEFVYSSELPS